MTILTSADDPAPVAATIALSLTSDNRVGPDLADYYHALEQDRDRMFTNTSLKPLAALEQWHGGPGDDLIRHQSGGFFTVQGLRVSMGDADHRAWDQPIVVQPEVGVLGIIAKQFDGVLHFLMQHKVEPGNRNGIQLSPTVQATRSNFTRLHKGSGIAYLEYFRNELSVSHRVIADVRHTEQGSWFFGKRNRNVVIEVFDDVEVKPGWYWLTLAQIADLLQHDDLVNMEVRSVLSCLPTPVGVDTPIGGTVGSLWRSSVPDGSFAHQTPELLSWITRARSDYVADTRLCPLADVKDWDFTHERLSHHSGRYFSVIGVDVTAGGREVKRWDQPMVSAGAGGIVAVFIAEIDGVTHLLLKLRAEAGGFDGPELAPSVQCDPGNYDPDALPPLLADVLAADPADILFDTMLSDEGGRFYHTSHRHVVVWTSDLTEPPGFRWFSLAQCAELAQHSHYLNVQTRSLLACVQSLLTTGL